MFCLTSPRLLQLSSTTLGSTSHPQKTLLVLHGLLGNSSNFKTATSKILSSLGPSWSALLLDVRGHGSSPSGSPCTILSAAHDVEQTVNTLTNNNGVDAVIGHSLGGKISLQYLSIAKKKPQSTWSLDSIPSKLNRSIHDFKEGDGSVASILDAVSTVEQPFESKKELINILTEEKKVQPSIAMWMTTNLKGNKKSGYNFVFDVETCRNLYESFGVTDLTGFLRETEERVTILKAERNREWKGITDEDIRGDNENVKVKTLEKSGHWVHVDNLDGLVSMICEDLKDI